MVLNDGLRSACEQSTRIFAGINPKAKGFWLVVTAGVHGKRFHLGDTWQALEHAAEPVALRGDWRAFPRMPGDGDFRQAQTHLQHGAAGDKALQAVGGVKRKDL